MRTALIGHRGVGKTSLLARVAEYYRAQGRACSTLDLDAEIARRIGLSAGEIFASRGEAKFRRLELETFARIDRETEGLHGVFVSLGAGFDPARLPASWRALWVRRPSDRRGRIFVGPARPRLNASLPPLAEFQERFAAREAGYRTRADDVLTLDEGLESGDFAERDFFLDGFSGLGGALTLLPENFGPYFDEWLDRRLRWGIRWFELRDDLLDENQIHRALEILPRERALLAFRSSQASAALTKAGRAGCAFDWPIEKGPCPVGEPSFLSLHERHPGEALAEALGRLQGAATLKAALPVAGFDELAEGHRWAEQDPARRVLLPHSPDGRWAWYRLLTGPKAPLAFIRESDGSSADQPTLLQWARRLATPGERFAAIVGDPVAHSRTPLEQAGFFRELGAPVLAIPMREAHERVLDFLHNLGLEWAAVTAPLKIAAFRSCRERTPLAEALGAVNTLHWRKGGWSGTNTDRDGFHALIVALQSERDLGKIAIWGGGGTLAMMKSVLPAAECFSVRENANREPGGVSPDDFRPDTVVWAASRASEPPRAWRPECVIDLNYFEDSPARAFALSRGADYVSGLAMFRAQAAGQRAFWARNAEER